VAGAIVEKLLRRHPHVFAEGEASTPEEVERAWEVIKAEERAAKAAAPSTRGDHTGGEAGHTGLLHGIPTSLPTMLAAEKALSRWQRTGGDLATLHEDDGDLGERLLALVARARERGQSADDLLREALHRFADERP
jgi:XTP/dITP diphosphohydrolase